MNKNIEIIVFLDTNIIYGDLHLKGAKFKALCSSVNSIGGTVYIPEVVIDEAMNKYKEELMSLKSRMAKVISDSKRLSDNFIFDNPFTDDFINNEQNKYIIEFRKQIRNLEIIIIPYPKISHKKLVERDLSRRKPFQETGKGYRDALIWESIENTCKKLYTSISSKYFFLNKNIKDFCDEKKCLHSDFKKDLEKEGISGDSVIIYDDIDSFMKKEIKPLQKTSQEILNILNDKKEYKDINLSNELEHIVSDFLLYRVIDYDESPFGPEFENPSVAGIQDISFIVTDVRSISDEKNLIEIAIESKCEFDFYLFKSDVMCMDDKDLPYIYDSDWNKHYMAASKTATIKLQVSLIVDTYFMEILSDDIQIVVSQDR